LLPAYIGESDRDGSGVFDPIRNTGFNYLFYKINRYLNVDMADLEKSINTLNVKALLLIHYFGFPQKEICKIAALCKQKKILLIEDCAHTLESMIQNKKLGFFGDVSFYSLHKLIASQRGGYLQINHPDLLYLMGLPVHNRISQETMEQYLKTDILQISKKRIANYQSYLQLLSRESEGFEIMFPALEDGVVPLNFPILIKNGSRLDLYYYLESQKIVTVSLYYRMVSELQRQEFPISFAISDTILNLPVHQDITDEDVKYICKVLNSI
jgi:dTDP-4-amino-4,6-dideoxygalactose transaminase